MVIRVCVEDQSLPEKSSTANTSCSPNWTTPPVTLICNNDSEIDMWRLCWIHTLSFSKRRREQNGTEREGKGARTEWKGQYTEQATGQVKHDSIKSSKIGQLKWLENEIQITDRWIANWFLKNKSRGVVMWWRMYDTVIFKCTLPSWSTARMTCLGSEIQNYKFKLQTLSWLPTFLIAFK